MNIQTRMAGVIAGSGLVVGALAGGIVLAGLDGDAGGRQAVAGEEEQEPTPEAEESDDPEDEDEDRGDNFKELVAEELGVSVDELEDAFEAASLTMLDEAVAEGRISEEEADEIRSRIEEGAVLRPFATGFHRGFVWGRLAPLMGVGEVLGLEPGQLREALQSGSTLAEVAADAGISVDELTETILSNLGSRLDQAVAADRIRQERADELYERFEANLDDLLNRVFNGEPAGEEPEAEDTAS